jgi:hypothetical protein
MDFNPLVTRKQLAKERRSYLPTLSLVLLVVVELLLAFYAALICLRFYPTLAVCERDIDIEAPQDRVLLDIEFVAIVALVYLFILCMQYYNNDQMTFCMYNVL